MNRLKIKIIIGGPNSYILQHVEMICG